MLSDEVIALAAKQPLKAVEFEPEADPPSMKLLYKDGSVEIITLGMHIDEVRAKVRDTYKHDPYCSEGCPYDSFSFVPLSFYYSSRELTLKRIVFGDVDHEGSTEEVIRALEVKAYFRHEDIIKDLLETPQNKLCNWFEDELDFIATGGDGFIIDDIGLGVGYYPDSSRAYYISMGFSGDPNL